MSRTAGMAPETTARIAIGVSGGSASGKTEIARAAARALKPVATMVLSEDDYYGDHGASPDFEAAHFNFDHPQSRDHTLLAKHLAALKSGKPVKAPIYDFTIHRRRSDTRTLQPAEIVFVEGIHLFCTPALRELFDIKVYVDAPDDIRLARRLLRDAGGLHRGSRRGFLSGKGRGHQAKRCDRGGDEFHYTLQDIH